MKIVITTDGQARCIYDEAIDLNCLGAVRIRRASHVEPTESGCWQADLRPLGGPVLKPFARRSDALSAELAWLEQYWLDRSTEEEN